MVAGDNETTCSTNAGGSFKSKKDSLLMSVRENENGFELVKYEMVLSMDGLRNVGYNIKPKMEEYATKAGSEITKLLMKRAQDLVDERKP